MLTDVESHEIANALIQRKDIMITRISYNKRTEKFRAICTDN